MVARGDGSVALFLAVNEMNGQHAPPTGDHESPPIYASTEDVSLCHPEPQRRVCMDYPHRTLGKASTSYPGIDVWAATRDRKTDGSGVRCPDTLWVTMWVIHTGLSRWAARCFAALSMTV